MTTKDLITAIAANKSADIQAAFDAAMNDRLVNAIGAFREAVTEEVFGEESEDLATQPSEEENEE